MKLSKEKQQSLLKLSAITLVVLGALWFFLVSPAQTRLNQKNKASDDLTQKISSKRQLIQRAAQIQVEAQEKSKKLSAIEEQMVTGDPYVWGIKALRDFEIPGHIEFTKVDPPQIIESDVPPRLPYKTASFAVTGTATYHDLGTFLANFENSYPHILIHRLEMEPASLGTKNNDEKLSFLFEMQVRVKPGSASSGSKPAPRS